MKLDFTTVARKPEQQFTEMIQIILFLSDMQNIPCSWKNQEALLSLPAVSVSEIPGEYFSGDTVNTLGKKKLSAKGMVFTTCLKNHMKFL